MRVINVWPIVAALATFSNMLHNIQADAFPMVCVNMAGLICCILGFIFAPKVRYD